MYLNSHEVMDPNWIQNITRATAYLPLGRNQDRQQVYDHDHQNHQDHQALGVTKEHSKPLHTITLI